MNEVVCFTYYSPTQDTPDSQRLRIELCTKEAEPFLTLPLVFDN